jgi:hypothetical protein
MAAVNYRLPKGNGHQAEKSTVVMTAMKAKFFSPQEPRVAFVAAKTIFCEIIEN